MEDNLVELDEETKYWIEQDEKRREERQKLLVEFDISPERRKEIEEDYSKRTGYNFILSYENLLDYLTPEQYEIQCERMESFTDFLLKKIALHGELIGDSSASDCTYIDEINGTSISAEGHYTYTGDYAPHWYNHTMPIEFLSKPEETVRKEIEERKRKEEAKRKAAATRAANAKVAKDRAEYERLKKQFEG